MYRFFNAPLFAAATITVALPPFAHAQSPSSEWKERTVQLELFGQFPSLQRPVLSPGGTRMAARVRSGGVQALAIVPISEPGAKPYIVARDADFSKDSVGDREIYQWSWIDDDNLLIWLRSRDNQMGQWFDVTRVAAFNIKTRKATPLGWDGAAGSAGIVLWKSPPGTPNPHILLARHSNKYGSELWFNPEVIDIEVETGKTSVVQRPNPVVKSWIADAGGVVRMGADRDADSGKVRVIYRDNASSSFRTILNEKQDMHTDSELPDEILTGSDKAYALSNREGYRSLYEYDLTKMALGSKIFSVPGYDIGGIALTPDGTALQSVFYTDQRSRVEYFDPHLKKIAKLFEVEFGAGNFLITSADQKRSKFIVTIAELGQVPAYYLFDAASNNLRLLSWSNDTFKDAKLNPVETIRYKASDGKEIEAVLTRPRHHAGQQRLPLIVMPHGGPWARDDADWDAFQWAQAFAEYGYVVIQPNYRGSTGYGRDFGKAVDGNWGLRMQDDLNDAVTWLARDGTIDPKRVCMIGWSYGGYAASRAAQRDGDKYRCTVSGAGVHDLPAMVQYDKGYLGNYGAKTGLGAAGDLKEISPAFHAEMFSTPILIVHGARDQRVPVAQSRTLVSKLKAAGKREGVDFVYIEQPLNTHNLLREEDRVQFLREVKKFLDKYNPA